MLEVSLVIFLSTLLLAILLTPIVRMLARKLKVVDCPDSRKIHKGNIPRLGGISIFLSVLIGSLFYFGFAARYIPDNHASTQAYFSIFVGAALMVLLGLADDTKRMRASKKLIYQLSIASLVYLLGFRIEFIRFFDGIFFDLGILSYFFTVLWIVGITNSVNLIDGMDGLASGISIVAFIFIAVIAVLFGNYHVAVISFAFCGALIGFMKYNFHPASIFMGDSGSLFLGYFLAIFSVQAMRNGHLQFSILISCLILAIPILDTSLAIARRFVKYYVRNGHGDTTHLAKIKRILYPDSEHIHHRLLARGFNQRQVSIRLYSISIAGGLVAIALNYISANMIILLLTAIVLATIKFVDYLNFGDFAIDKSFNLLSIPKAK